MKAYKQELTHFYSKKSDIDEKMKKNLKKTKEVDKKKEVIESSKQDREEEQVDDEDLNLLRKHYVRMSDYLKQLDDKIAILYEKYNQFKLNILYENITAHEGQLKDIETFERDIEELKQLKIKNILKANKKKEDMEELIKDFKIKISERQHEYNEAESIEEKKQIYTEAVSLKLQLFEIFRENISIINIESKTDDIVSKYSTIVIDYTPIKKNQKKLKDKLEMGLKVNEEKPVKLDEVELEEVELGEDELGEDELGEVKLNDSPKTSDSF
jgi:hypothetical protein